MNQKNEVTYFLNPMAIIFFIVGFIIPFYFGIKLGDVIKNNASVLIIPIYFGFVCIVFAALTYCESLIIDQPEITNSATLWIENVLKTFGVILIILGILSFIIAIAKSNNTFSYIENMGIIGGTIALLFNLMLAALCLGLAGIHNKYNGNDIQVDLRSTNTIASKSSYCSNCGKEFTSNMKGGFCEECGNKL